jgi:hypothetical protein
MKVLKTLLSSFYSKTSGVILLVLCMILQGRNFSLVSSDPVSMDLYQVPHDIEIAQF